MVVSPWAGIHKAPGLISPYDHFPGFPHKRFLWNMMVRVQVSISHYIYTIILNILSNIDNILS